MRECTEGNNIHRKYSRCWSVCTMHYGSMTWWSVCRASARVGRAARTYSNHNEHQPLCPRETIDLVRGQGYDPSSTGFWGKRSSEGGNWCQVTAVSNPEASPPSLMTGAPPRGRIDTTQWWRRRGAVWWRKETIGRLREVELVH